MEQMKDPNTTFRTKAHTRKLPADPRPRVTAESNGDNYEEAAKKYPWLDAYGKAIAAARLAMYNQDKWDKTMGWMEAYDYPPNPVADMFVVAEDGTVTPTAKAEKMFDEDPDGFDKADSALSEWLKTRGQPQLVLKPMTREQAEKTDPNAHWSPTTDEYMLALEDAGIADEDVLRNYAQRNLEKMLLDDMRSGRFQYYNALRNRFLKGDKNITADDTTKIKQHEGFGQSDEKKEFDKYSTPAIVAANAAAPFNARVMLDPELNYKTGIPERIARGAGDLGLLATYIMMPEALATKAALTTGLGSAFAKGGLRSLASRGAIRAGSGATAGAAGWGEKALGDVGLENATGTGVNRGPLDLRDLALEAGTGALANLASTQLLRGGKRSDNAFLLRSKMSNDPSVVKLKDIKESFDVTKGAVNKNAPELKREFADRAMAEYRQAYPNEVMEVEYPPKLQVRTADDIIMRPVIKLPEGQSAKKIIAQESEIPGSELYGAVEGVGRKGAGVWTTPKGKRFVEKASDPRFFNRYMAANPEYFKEFSDESVQTGLKDLMNESQIAGSPASNLFTGSKKVLPRDTWRAKFSEASGNLIPGESGSLKNIAMKNILKKNTPGQMNGNEFVPANKKQLDELAKASKKMHDRKQMNLVSESDLDAQRNYQLFGSEALGKGSKIAGFAARTVGVPVVMNNTQLASREGPRFLKDLLKKYVGEPTEPIKYEDNNGKNSNK